MTKYIIVAGGVISGVGKGVSTASIGKILKEYGFSVTAIKIDPYINYDAGTLRPTEHGEVWVTDDGGEIDQDLGNYERFLEIDVPKKNNITTGQIYKTVIDRERKGEYLGKTVQFIPHIPDEVKRRIVDAGKGYDFALVEIGGTVGDYENVPFLFAMKSLERDIGKENILYVLVTYLLIPRHTEEMKTKPTQQAIRMLAESSGIFPDFILCRAPIALDEVRRKKIEVYANIKSDYIISEPDIDTIYRIPLDLEKEKIGEKILDKFGLLEKKKADFSKWEKLVNNIASPLHRIKVGIVGKYVDSGEFMLSDSYISVNQALIHAGANLDVKVEIEWVDAKKLEKDEFEVERLTRFNGIIIPGGFGSSGVEGKIKAIKFCRERNVPFLGLCYGMQLALVEFARNVCGLDGANTSEVEEDTKYPVIDILDEQKEVLRNHDYGASMRLGSFAAILDENSIVYNLYNKRLEEDAQKILNLKGSFRLGILNSEKAVLERHRHRYEVNPVFVDVFQDNGMRFSGWHIMTNGLKLMEFIELPSHKYFVATQAHPEFKSSLENPAPLFFGFVKACLE
ncbi:CTP synthase (glutamine hydrolyzing) [Candidatus Woesearchaeota archaeon]|nr:CTP synthase (glutamine hydrolyzing) [Candidatus Woesearchaeota archaeon]